MKKTILLLAITALLFSCSENTTKEAVVEEVAVEETNTEPTDEEIIKEGKTIAKASFEAMKGKLMSAMKSGGVEKAAGFCHTNASSLTDSLAKHYNVEIKRTSLKYRNDNNAPSSKEEEVLKMYEADFANSKDAKKPKVLRTENTIDFYAPILVAKPCLKCHGTLGETMKETDYSHIKTLYPQDLATGYALEDFRGVWHITFKK